MAARLLSLSLFSGHEALCDLLWGWASRCGCCCVGCWAASGGLCGRALVFQSGAGFPATRGALAPSPGGVNSGDGGLSEGAWAGEKVKEGRKCCKIGRGGDVGGKFWGEGGWRAAPGICTCVGGCEAMRNQHGGQARPEQLQHQQPAPATAAAPSTRHSCECLSSPPAAGCRVPPRPRKVPSRYRVVQGRPQWLT